MHPEILSPEQKSLIPLVRHYSGKFILVGGTAIALQIGHRKSIDFDLFTNGRLNIPQIKSYLYSGNFKSLKLLFQDTDQLHFLINSVKFTFLSFPYHIKQSALFDKKIPVPSLLTLAAMKAYAIGNRMNWKDYLDLYYIIRDHHSLSEIIKEAGLIFNGSFNAKLFLEQLTWFNDLSKTEKIDFITEPVGEEEIKSFLTRQAAKQLSDL